MSGARPPTALAHPLRQFDEFWMAGVAAVGAIFFTNPVDVVKTRLMLQGELTANRNSSVNVYRGVTHSMCEIFQSEGMRGLQRGLSAACLLQFTNVGTRFGVYGLAKHVCEITSDTPYRYAKSLVLAGCSGSCAAVVSNPFYLFKTRLQSASPSASLAVGRTSWDSNAGLWDVCRTVHRTEGFLGFYRGLSAFIPRVAAASSVQLATYDIAKDHVISWSNEVLQRRGGTLLDGRSFWAHFGAAWITGIAVVFAMQPFDFAATRMMNDGCGLYSSSFAVLWSTVRGPEGVLGIFKGTTANYLRFGPYCILVFVFLEQLKISLAK